MKIALAYDYLNQWGGGERVLGALADLFPQAPIYTLLYDKEKFNGRFDGRRIITSFLDWPFARQRHRALIPLMPLAARLMRVDPSYDLVISLSAGYGKGIRCAPNTKHIAYCLTPLRYGWEERQFNVHTFQLRSNDLFFKPIQAYLRRWDYAAAQRPDVMVAPSRFIAEKIKDCYGRDANIVYPPVDNHFFFDPAILKQDYFLAAGRLMQYKRFDLIIEAFNELRLPLKIVGIGPEYARLRSLIRSPQIEMTGFIPDNDLRLLYAGARAFIFPHSEDFGLVGVEALACGTPVIGFAAGGVLEIVAGGETGVLFHAQTIPALCDAVRYFISREDVLAPARCADAARAFSLQSFTDAVSLLVLSLDKNYESRIRDYQQSAA